MKLSDEKGIALITALLFMAIGLIVALASTYLVFTGMRVSGIKKTYQTALEAAHGGVELTTMEVIPKIISGTATTTVANDYTEVSLSFPSGACLNRKLNNATGTWGVCNSTLDPTTSPDMTFTLRGVPPQPNFIVYTKIVDTVEGNSNTSGLVLEGLGVAESGSGVVTPQHYPYIYRVEVQGQKQTAADERANLTVLFAY